MSRVFLMDRAGSDLDGVKESLVKASPDGQVCRMFFQEVVTYLKVHTGEGDVRERGDWDKNWDECSQHLGQVGADVNL